MRGLRDKCVLITGCDSRVGRATAARFIEEGARVVVLERDTKTCEHIARETPGVMATFAADISDARQVQHALGNIVIAMGGLDVLINDAGACLGQKVLDIASEEWDRTWAANLAGVLNLSQIATRYMMQHSGGVVLNLAAMDREVGHLYYAGFDASRGRVLELTRSMALELAPKVRVNAVAPGYVPAPMRRPESGALLEAVPQSTTSHRHAEPHDIAALLAFLASDDAAHLTGQVYVMDGHQPEGMRASS